MSALMDIWHAIQGLLTSADYITLGLIVVIAIVAGVLIQGLNSVISATFWSLVAFAALGFARAITLGHQDAIAFAKADWHAFLGMGMLTLVAYSVVFIVLIAVVNVIRSAVR
ncbi:MAG: hypothetical protein KGJ78_04910 [Alphaproteobacteria bacterium]|nr:hypothetical protein [Alphaproteobacteria bacterium]